MTPIATQQQINDQITAAAARHDKISWDEFRQEWYSVNWTAQDQMWYNSQAPTEQGVSPAVWQAKTTAAANKKHALYDQAKAAWLNYINNPAIQ